MTEIRCNQCGKCRNKDIACDLCETGQVNNFEQNGVGSPVFGRQLSVREFEISQGRARLAVKDSYQRWYDSEIKNMRLKTVVCGIKLVEAAVNEFKKQQEAHQ